MTKEEMLQQLTSDDLRNELRRRAMEKRKALAEIPRCRNCKHFGTVTYWGGVPQGKTECCPYKLSRNKKHHLVLKPTSFACEHYNPNES